MNKEEILNKYIDLIDKGYCSDCNELNCIDNFPHSKIARAIRELQQENEKLKDRDLIIAAELTKLQDENIRLKKESQKQKEVIDKAINWTIKYQTEWCQEDEVIRDLKQLLNILKEVLK